MGVKTIKLHSSKTVLPGFGHINHCGGYKLLPPDTGASIKTAPIFSAATAISLDTAGSMVLESMSREPFFTFLCSKSNKYMRAFKVEFALDFKGHCKNSPSSTLNHWTVYILTVVILNYSYCIACMDLCKPIFNLNKTKKSYD